MKASFRTLSESFEADVVNLPQLKPIQYISLEALKANIFKKFLKNKSPDADRRALDKFLASNQRCKEWVYKCESLLDSHLLGEFEQQIHRFWWLSWNDSICSSFDDMYRHGRTGPGVSIGATGNSYYSKLFSSRLTCTSPYLYMIYKNNCQNSPITAHAELARVSDYGEFKVVEGSRLSFVPKSDEISRVICVEPSLNMFFQMGFKHILESRLRAVYQIDLGTQPELNRELALEGSITGQLSTIDLSSASDSIGLKMLKRFFPRNWVNMMSFLRSSCVRLPDGRFEELHMVSSMGNAFTFPLETIIFRAVVAAAAIVDGGVYSRRSIGVFGDDIICPTKITSKVLRLLALLGFEVNSSKTFVEGPFRESCGHDYFNGHDVRPIFIKSIDSQQDRYVAINLLNAWTAKSGIPLPLTVSYLLSSVRRNYVPPAENLDAGILVPQGFLSKLSFDSNGSVKYYPYRAKLVSLRVNPDTLKISGFKSKLLSRNPAGLLESFLRGYIRDHSIPIRHDWLEYSTKRAVTPNWDYIPTASSLGGILNPLRFEINKRRWNFAVYCNMLLQ